MAIVWANATGNWGTTTLWDYWDEDSQSIQPYGQVPQVGDYVYANGYTITIPANSTINIGNGTLSNGDNPYTNRSGGTFYYNAAGTYNIIANIEGYGYSTTLGNTAVSGNGRKLNLTGNVTSYSESSNFVIRTGGSGGSTYINGNLIGANCLEIQWNYVSCTINGNIINNTSTKSIYLDMSSGGGTPTASATINGNAENQFIQGGGSGGSLSLSIMGTYTHSNNSSFNKSISRLRIGDLINTGSVIVCTDLIIEGAIQYKSSNNQVGVRYNTLLIQNPDTFTWKDVTEPRSNPFIILTDAEMNNRQQYPPEDEVKEGTEYVWGEKVGTYQQPPESVVLKDYVYDNGDKIGSLENQNIVGCVTREDVREGVALIGMGEVGTLVVPSVDDVREGVVFDNGSVGTLIVQGGGDRLRIADFGYYTRSTSITYIVDLTESDKPAFADCEEIVLRSLFPTLDLDNIPDKFFDDLFIQFLRYRLLVEYYRGTSINSKFTPSEPTTEIVNYANTKCEYWLNTANLFLQLWGEKYPNSVKKDRILL